METPVHQAIVRSAVNLLPPELQQELDTPIPESELTAFRVQQLAFLGQKEYDQVSSKFVAAVGEPAVTYLDLTVFGSKLEDSTKVRSPLKNPDSQDVAYWLLPDDYHPWLEHYWDPSLNPDKGLTITTGFVSEVIGGLAILGEGVMELANGILGAATGDATIVLGQYRSCLSRALSYWQTWVIEPYLAGRKPEAYLNLGRVCHLLADAGTPAHVQNDPHLGISWIELLWDEFPQLLQDLVRVQDEDYETRICELVEAHNRSLPPDLDAPASAPIIFNPDWDLSRHFTELAEISRLYDSDDVDGMGSGHPYHWDHWYDSLANTLPIDRDITGDLTDHAARAIGRDMVPNTVQFTAGLLCMFYRAVGYRFRLDTLEVRLEKITVLDDTDPFGNGEIYLKAWLDGCRKQQFGEYDMGSGDSKTFKNVVFSAVIRDPDAETYLNLSCYDDDGNYFWDDSESLGSITLPIVPRDIPPAGQRYLVDSVGGSGRFRASILVRLLLCGESDERVEELPGKYREADRFRDNTVELRQTRYNLRRNPPLYLNLKSLKYHHTADRKHPRPCGIWAKLPAEQKLQFSCTPEELMRRRADGSTLLLDVLRAKFGEQNPYYRNALRPQTLESECACTRDGF
jgi:hypothetical protein